MNRKSNFWQAAAVIAAVSLTACGNTGNVGNSGNTGNAPAANSGAAAALEPQAGTSESIGRTDIIFAQAADITSIDPAGQSEIASSVLIKHVYSTLLDIDNDGNLVGDLAESYELQEDTDYVFKLREDAVFSDGTPVTAEDVKFTFERAMTMPKTKSNTSKIKDVTADNDKQVTIRLDEPYAAFPSLVAGSKLSIVSKAAVTAAGDSYGDAGNVLGSGEFVVKEWIPNDHYMLVRNENYWGEMPKATSITCRVIPESSARAIALETGEIDLIWKAAATDVLKLEENPEVTCMSQLDSSVEYLGMNTKKEIFSDKRVRQAVSYALDKQSFTDTVLEGRGEVANSMVAKTIPGWNSDLEPYPQDLAKAKELMAEAGYPDGFSCSVYVFGEVRNRSAQLVQAQLAEIGIKVDISMLEGGAMTDAVNAGEPDLFIMGWSNASFDPDGSVYQLFHSNNLGASGNRTFLSDPELDQAIIAAARETDAKKRLEMYQDIQVTLKDLAPCVPLYYAENTTAIRTGLEGFELQKGGQHYLGNCHYEN